MEADGAWKMAWGVRGGKYKTNCRYGQCVARRPISVQMRSNSSADDSTVGAGQVAADLVLKQAAEQLSKGFEVVGVDQEEKRATGGPAGGELSSLSAQTVRYMSIRKSPRPQ